MSAQRIVSLLPSATEIVAALGLADRLVGRSHECDFPPGVENLPVCSRPRIVQGGTSQEIDQRVRDILAQGLSMYVVDAERLWELEPDFILAQTQCSVCAVTPGDLQAALLDWPDPDARPQTVAVEPNGLADVWAGIQQVGKALGVADAAERLVAASNQRLAALRARTARLDRPRLAILEWTAPLMVAGNWMPDLVEAAGGSSLLSVPGQRSMCVTWETLAEADPDVIVITPCGFEVERGAIELEQLADAPQWAALRAVQAGRVYLADGAHYINRPGPRLVESAEIIAEILHPEHCDFGHRGVAWMSAEDWLAAAA